MTLASNPGCAGSIFQKIVGILAVFSSLSLFAQTYQSSFSTEKFDRAAVPSSLHGQVEVEAPTGAVSISVPLGPGIGARGVRFAPVLRGRVAPSTTLRTAQHITHDNLGLMWASARNNCVLKQRQDWPEASPYHYLYQGHAFDSQSTAYFALSPGYLDLPVSNQGFSYGKLEFPDGRSFTYPRSLPISIPGGADPLSLVGTFPGYQSGWSIAATGLSYRVASGGQLVVGLVSAELPMLSIPYLCRAVGGAQFENRGIGLGGGYAVEASFPRRVLVIDREIAYEYTYAATKLDPVINWHTDYDPTLAQLSADGKGYNDHVADTPSEIRYRLTSILNRTGDRISFQYNDIHPGAGATGWRAMPEYTATWNVDGQTIASVKVNKLGCSYSAQSGAQPSYSFTGVLAGGPHSTSNISFEVPWDSASDALAGPMDSWDAFSVQSVVDQTSQDKIEFEFGEGPVAPLNTFPTGINCFPLPAFVLTKVQLPGKTLRFDWKSYPFRRNVLPGPVWNGYRGVRTEMYKDQLFPATAAPLVIASSIAGVIGVNEDVANGPSRSTYHDRKVPIPTYDKDLEWDSTQFYDAVHHPDGQVTLYRFSEPVPDVQGGIGSDPAVQFQTLAHLKHQVEEVRHYATSADWLAEASNIQQPSTKAYRVEVRDRFDVRGLGDVGIAGIPDSSVPYPTRTRTWDADSATLTVEESQNWDSSAFKWTKTSKAIFPWTSGTPIPIERLSLPLQPNTPENPTGFLSTQTQNTTYENHGNEYIFALPIRREVVRSDNATLSLASYNPPIESWTYENPSIGVYRIKTSAVSASDQAIRTLAYTYAGLSGASALQVRSLVLTQPNVSLSGNVGISQFMYDSAGYLKSIQPLNGFVVRQTQNELGYVGDQTNENDIQTIFVRDNSGRITNINFPNGEVSTQINYHADSLGYTESRGVQEREVRFNGFGAPVLEIRKGKTSFSSRGTGYDVAGRKSWEGVWQNGKGSESSWSLPSDSGEPILTSTVCEEWEPVLGGEEPRCLSWVTQSSKTYSNPITRYEYEPRGRVASVLSPNGEIQKLYYDRLKTTKISYTSGVFKSTDVPNGALVTIFEKDQLGRLCKVTDPKGQVTQYRYDTNDRIAALIQWSGPVGTLPRQDRTWEYDGLGRLKKIVQPESGTTTYSMFDVNGKPWVVNYNNRIVRSTFDSLGRICSSVADDGSVNQHFLYDEEAGQSHGLSKGKLVKGYVGAVERSLTYAGRNGRLSGINRKIDDLSLSQSFDYDAYGHLISRTYPDGKIQSIQYSNEMSLPSTISYNNQGLANFAYDPISWNLSTLAYLGAANGASSSFTYRKDHIGLASLNHQIPGKAFSNTWVFIYDGAGRLMTDGADSFTYDPLGRLKTAAVADLGAGAKGLFQTFDYDAFGNRISASNHTVMNWTPPSALPPYLSPSPTLRPGLNEVTANVTFSASDPAFLKNRIPETTTTGAHYDAQGNLERVYTTPGNTETQVNMTYDALGRVTSLSYGPNASRVTEQYLHDDEGLRIRIWDGTEYRYNIYNEARQLIAQYEKTPTGSLTWKKDIIYVGTKEIAEVSPTGTSITMTDHLGSPRFIWAGGTNPVIKQKFLPFGEPLTLPADAAGISKGFTNHEQTDASKLIYMQARFYLPMWGRFASPDPGLDQHFEFTQSWNIYSYVQNNPTMMVDPTGMVTSDAGDFLKGFVFRVADNATFGLAGLAGRQMGFNQESQSLAFHVGALSGDGATFTAGGSTATGGTGASVALVGSGVGAPGAVVTGSVAAYGAGVAVKSGVATVQDMQLLMSAMSKGGTGAPAEPSGGDGAGSSGRPELTSNGKHHPGAGSPEPGNVKELYKDAIPASNGTQWVKGKDGVIHRFSAPSNGQTHWNGSTGGKKPIRNGDIPREIRKKLDVKG